MREQEINREKKNQLGLGGHMICDQLVSHDNH